MLKTNSKEVMNGDTFIALKGEKTDGHNYINEAIERGAVKVIVEHGSYSVDTMVVPDTKQYIKDFILKHKKEIENIKCIGVTGTNGKTTTCYLLKQALNALGKKCAYIGTIGFYIENKIKDLGNTTPGMLDLYYLLLEAKKQGCEYITIEVSSHALAQDRVYGIDFDVVIITNITQDHLDYHHTMEEYAKAKSLIFNKLKPNGYAIIPEHIPYKEFFLLDKNKNIIYGENGNYKLENVNTTNKGSSFALYNDGIINHYEIKLLGLHNVYNIINVIIILKEEGLTKIEETVTMLSAPRGRMEEITYSGFSIIIDYAHTPDAVLNMIQSIQKIVKGRIITIVGCGGDRDKTKRPIMAEIATKESDYVIFTSDNSRTENPEDIMNDMTNNLKQENYEIEINRENAIQKGIQKCVKDDILLILGKGHENYQIIGNEKIHFDDLEVVEKYIRR